MPSYPKVATPTAEPDSAPAWTSASSAPEAAPWTKPLLSVYGDVRQLTMGVTPGAGESGFELTRHT
jgi:hypothetical protein